MTSESITGAAGGENGSSSYGLDPVGNRQTASSSVPGLSSVGGTFNADDELASENYDSDGNVTASGGKTFTYDTENRLLSMGSTVAIVYDGDGNRVAKTVSGVTTRYLVDDLNPTGYAQVVEELSGGGSVQRQYTYGLQRISQNQLISNTWTPSFYGYDGFGTVRQLTNSTGAITDTYDYDAFGNKINSTGSTPNNYLYRGEQYDPDLGLYHLRARYYNPITGRFMGRDPEDGDYTDPATLHKYVYANGDPVNLADPSGRAGTGTLSPPQTQTKGVSLEYLAIATTISLAPAAYVDLVGQTLNCDYTFEGSVVENIFEHIGFPGFRLMKYDACHQNDGCTAKHPDWPVNYVYYSDMPITAAHIATAIAKGKPDALTYLGKYQQGPNRSSACPSGDDPNRPYSSPDWCDEYPYASTAEGGKDADTWPVTEEEGRRQAGSLRAFYASFGYKPNTQFCVVVTY